MVRAIRKNDVSRNNMINFFCKTLKNRQSVNAIKISLLIHVIFFRKVKFGKILKNSHLKLY